MFLVQNNGADEAFSTPVCQLCVYLPTDFTHPIEALAADEPELLVQNNGGNKVAPDLLANVTCIYLQSLLILSKHRQQVSIMQNDGADEATPHLCVSRMYPPAFSAHPIEALAADEERRRCRLYVSTRILY